MTKRHLIPETWRTHVIASLRAHHRGLIWTLEAIAFLLAGVVILIAAAAYRLDRGPLEVQFLTPQLVAWLDHQIAPLQVTVADTSLRWSAGDADLAISVGGVTVTDPVGDLIASIPSVELGLSLRALALGLVRPTVVTIDAPSIHLQRGANGTFYLRPGPVPVAKPLPSIPTMLAGLGAWVQRDRDVSGTNRDLRHIYLRDGTMWVDDQRIGRTWHLGQLAIDLTRSAPKYITAMRADIDDGANHIHLTAAATHDVATLKSTYRLAIDRVVPARWAPLLPDALAAAKSLDLPVAATVSGSVDLALGKIDPIEFAANAQAGQILDPRLDRGRLMLKNAKLSGSFDLDSGLLDLAHIALDLGGPTVDGAVTVTQIGHAGPSAPISIALTMAAHNVPRQGMEGYWPPVPVPKTRAWVLGHVSAGRLLEMTLKGHWEIHPDLPHPVVKKQLDGTMRFEGITLDYLHGLAPATDLDATAKLSIDQIQFDATRAHVLGFTLRHGTATIDGLNDPDAPSIMSLDLDLAGPARDGIVFLAAPRLHIADKIGIAPDDVAGAVEGPIQVRFPILKSGDTPADSIDYRGTFHLTGAGLKKGALGRDISDGDVTLAVDRNHIKIEGKAAIATVPAQFTWENLFSDSAPIRSRLHVVATVDDAGRKHLAIDPLPGAVHGPVGVEADATINQARQTQASVRLDFKPSTLTLGEANWSKPPGAAAGLTMLATIEDGRWRQIRALDAHGPSLDLQGELDFDENGVISRARSDHLAIGATDAAALVLHDRNGWRVTLSGHAIDATGYVSRFDQPSTPEDRATAPPVAIAITTDKLTLGPDRVMRAARFTAEFNHLALQRGDLKARVGEHGHLSFHLDLPEDGGAILATSDDMGAAARVINLSNHVAGGTASIVGRCVRIAGVRHFTAQLEAKDYRLVQAPVLAKILSLASFTSITSLLSGEGVPFSQMSADLALTDGEMTIDHGRAYGDAMGLVAEGDYNFNSKRLTLTGTLVPAYFLNGVLANVPVVGKYLAGGTGEGLFGANFKVGGAVDNPSITVNPLSILAPGLLRDLFLFQAPKPSEATPSAKPVPLTPP